MQAAPSATSTAIAIEPRDWLGYQRYADALWARVVHNFALHSEARAALSKDGKSAGGRELPTGDPLVIGVYGEWGVGKSRLLELMYRLAAQQSGEECAQRALDPHAWANSRVLRLTVPVWFHPWKYEHEPHLAVPLLMHLAEAVQLTLQDGRNLRERTEEALLRAGTAAVDAAKLVQKNASWLGRAAKVANAVAGNGLVKATVGMAAGLVGMGAAASEALKLVEETAGKFAPKEGATNQDGGAAAKQPEASEKGSSQKATAQEAVPSVTADGRYYYNVHKYLRELTHITPARARETLKVRMDYEIHLNFVVFVDDLDRCLPEKAVEVLEVIKTVLNVESFAFVVALDDEVIERGISYRYKDYRFQNAKPDMPITGFEYLEKIVHLPFRLPPLTRSQAQDFMRRQEERLTAPVNGAKGDIETLPRLWFTTDPDTNEIEPTALVHLLLDSFDAYVPRKLGRALELFHQFQQMFARRNTPIQAPVTFDGNSSSVDARMVLFCVLLQLFAPEIFRMLRRRPELFGHWMRAYVMQSGQSSAVFAWQKTAPDQLMVLEISDADLYRWVALGSQAADRNAAGPNTKSQPPSGAGRDPWGTYLTGVQAAGDRYSIEQIRLPLAVVLSGFREMQRHAFAPLRLGGAMAFATGWTDGSVPRLQDYLNLFSDQVLAGMTSPSVSSPPAMPAAPSVSAGQPAAAAVTAVAPRVPAPQVPQPSAAAAAAAAAAAVATTTRRLRSADVGTVLELLRSADASTRAAVTDRLGLQRGEVLAPATVADLAVAMRGAGLDTRTALDALASLAPYLEPDTVAATKDWPVFAKPSLPAPEQVPDECVELARPYAVLAAQGLADPLGLSAQLVELAATMLKIVEGPESVTMPLRSTAADMLGAFGDPRFNFTRESPHLPAMLRDASEEPVAGFVRVRASGFDLSVPGHSGIVRFGADYFINRTLVTVQQYRAFVDDGGYQDDAFWDPPGLAWKRGDIDSVVPLTSGKSLIQRSLSLRVAPWRWAEQWSAPTRPVVGINWYEARAYAAWLQSKLSPQLAAAQLADHRVRLPTEPEWQRAAISIDAAHAGAWNWPWADAQLQQSGTGSFRLANVSRSRLGHTSSVGLFPANPLGLYDMAGNVWEWMDHDFVDIISNRFDAAKPVERYVAPQGGSPGMALRGGSWQGGLEDARVDSRTSKVPWEHEDNIGLRVALVPGIVAVSAVAA